MKLLKRPGTRKMLFKVLRKNLLLCLKDDLKENKNSSRHRVDALKCRETSVQLYHSFVNKVPKRKSAKGRRRSSPRKYLRKILQMSFSVLQDRFPAFQGFILASTSLQHLEFDGSVIKRQFKQCLTKPRSKPFSILPTVISKHCLLLTVTRRLASQTRKLFIYLK